MLAEKPYLQRIKPYMFVAQHHIPTQQPHRPRAKLDMSDGEPDITSIELDLLRGK
jgi:hypothetical protein